MKESLKQCLSLIIRMIFILIIVLNCYSCTLLNRSNKDEIFYSDYLDFLLLDAKINDTFVLNKGIQDLESSAIINRFRDTLSNDDDINYILSQLEKGIIFKKYIDFSVPNENLHLEVDSIHYRYYLSQIIRGRQQGSIIIRLRECIDSNHSCYWLSLIFKEKDSKEYIETTLSIE